MKKINFRIIAFILFAAIISSCGKEGPVGPSGANGANGATGAAGAVGPAGPSGTNGANGSVIYSGTIVPDASVGAIGDFYINLATGRLYGPKTTSGWGTGVSLKGPAGAAGTNGTNGVAGSQIYSGSGAPDASLGVDGDYYLDNTAYQLYGPKTDSGWGTPISLQGPEGNANVKTDEFSIGGSDWLYFDHYEFEYANGGNAQYTTRYYVRLNNTITQDVLDNGMVLVYFTASPSDHPDQWELLPYHFETFVGYTYNFVYVTSPGQVELEFYFSSEQASPTPDLGSYNDAERKFKVITVTGQTGTFMLAHHVNLNNYQEVSKVTGVWLKDKQNQK